MARSRLKYWTTEEIAYLKHLIKHGRTEPVIATRLGRSLASVKSAKNRYKVYKYKEVK